MCDHIPDNGTIAIDGSKLAFGMLIRDRRRCGKTRSTGPTPQGSLFEIESARRPRRAPALPTEDNTPEGLRALLEANQHYREVPWPEPFVRTSHRLRLGDARDLSWVPDSSVHLVVTSPPYWTLKEYAPGNLSQMGHFSDYELHLDTNLDRCNRSAGD